jgi:hypothetical protein
MWPPNDAHNARSRRSKSAAASGTVGHCLLINAASVTKFGFPQCQQAAGNGYLGSVVGRGSALSEVLVRAVSRPAGVRVLALLPPKPTR